MSDFVKKGTTSKMWPIFINDSSVTTGAGLTGLVYNSSGLTAYYKREGASASVQISLVDMTLGTWASGGFKQVDSTNMPGNYEIGLPDAALATGANWVVVELRGATNMAPVIFKIPLVAFDPADAVRLGLSALPNAAPAGAGGLPTVDANNRIVGTQEMTVANIAQEVWGADSRTLTQTAAQVTDILEGSDISLLRGDDAEISLTGLGSLVGRTKLWFTVKETTEHTDAESIIQVRETTGLLYLNGVAAGVDPLPQAAWASIVVDDEDEGDITITLDSAAMAQIPELRAIYDIQMLGAGGAVQTLSTAVFNVSRDVTRATS